MAHRSEKTTRFVAVILCVGVFLSGFSSGAFARSHSTRHVLSSQSLREPRHFQQFKGKRSERRFDLTRRKVIHLEQTTFWNRRPYQFATPLLADSTLYVGVDAGRFYAIETHPLRKIWTFLPDGGVHGAALVSEGFVFFGDIKGFAYGLDAVSGEKRWQAKLDDEIVAAPCLAGSRLFFATMSGRLYALDRSTGNEMWHTEAVEKGWGLSVRGTSPPVLASGSVLIGTATGMLLAYDQNNGHLRWSTQIGDRQARVFDVDAAPLVVDDAVYVASADGGLVRIDPKNGHLLWSTDVGGANNLLMHEGILYVSGAGVLSALRADEGNILWRQDFETPEISAPVYGKNYLAVVTTTDKLHLIDPQTGDVMLSRYVRKGSLGDPVMIGEEIAVLANTSRLMTFKVQELLPKKKRKK